MANIPGVLADLSHIETPIKVTGYNGAENICKAFNGTDIIVIVAGRSGKNVRSRAELFESSASIINSLAQAASQVCPKALIAVVTNPVNSVVPIVSEVFKKVCTQLYVCCKLVWFPTGGPTTTGVA